MMIEGHECFLVDDSTLDTVISVDGEEHRFDTMYASRCKYKDGIMPVMSDSSFRELCVEIIAGIEEK